MSFNHLVFQQDFCERYGLLLEEYLTHNGFHAVELAVQDRIVKRLLQVCITAL